MADWNGPALRLVLASAERFSDRAISRGSALVKTPSSRSRALLLRMTSADQRRTGAEREDRGALFLRARFFFAMADDPWARAGRFPARRSRKPRAQGWYARGRSRICYWGRPHFIELSTEG